MSRESESGKAYLWRNTGNDEEQITHIASNEEKTQGCRKQYLSFSQTVTLRPYYENINEECRQAMQVLCK